MATMRSSYSVKELIPLIRPSSKACNKKRVFAPLSCNETFNVGSNVIRMQRQIEIEDQQVAHLFYLLSDLGYVFVVISGSTNVTVNGRR